MFKSTRIGIILLLSHILSSVILGLIFRPKTIIQQDMKNENSNMIKKGWLFNHIVCSIVDTLKTLAIIFSFTTIFNVLSTFICAISSNTTYKLIVTGIFEISNGINMASLLNFTIQSKIIVASGILSFSSIMILFQIYSALFNCNVKFGKIFIAKIFHGILSCRDYIYSSKICILQRYTCIFCFCTNFRR